MNSTDLAAKVAALKSDLARIETEREQCALDAESGVAVSARTLSDLNVEKGRLAAAIDQAQLAHRAALAAEEAEARREARLREEEEARRVQALKQATYDAFAEVDAATIVLRDLLLAAREAYDEVRALGDPGVNMHFYGEVAPRISTVLAGSGFGFSKIPFHTTDEKRRPDAAEQALVKRLPFAISPSNPKAA